MAVALATGLTAAACASSHGSGPAPRHSERAGQEGASAAASAVALDTSAWRGQNPAHAEELLAGRFPGVEVVRLTSGEFTVRIRGASTIAGSSEPLYVIDGTEITPGPGGALGGINPGDIARIEVLKDIGSTAAYGVRGANGVILITTRRGP